MRVCHEMLHAILPKEQLHELLWGAHIIVLLVEWPATFHDTP
jgi:hypothetical protein